MADTLFDLEPTSRAAAISRDGAYRYSLPRELRRSEHQPRWVTFVMLNPRPPTTSRTTRRSAAASPSRRRWVGPGSPW